MFHQVSGMVVKPGELQSLGVQLSVNEYFGTQSRLFRYYRTGVNTFIITIMISKCSRVIPKTFIGVSLIDYWMETNIEVETFVFQSQGYGLTTPPSLSRATGREKDLCSVLRMDELEGRLT